MNQEAKFEDCDGVIWAVRKIETEEEIRTEMEATVYNLQSKRAIPTELGFKYNILTFRENDLDSIEFTKAIIGDVKKYVDNNARVGYNGFMVKENCVPKTTIKKMFRSVLENCNFPGKMVKEVVSQI